MKRRMESRVVNRPKPVNSRLMSREPFPEMGDKRMGWGCSIRHIKFEMSLATE